LHSDWLVRLDRTGRTADRHRQESGIPQMLTPTKKAAGGFKITTAIELHNATYFIAACASQESATNSFSLKPFTGSAGRNIALRGAGMGFISVLDTPQKKPATSPTARFFHVPNLKLC